MNIKDYDVKGTTKCDCGHEFTIQDYTELKRINEPGFYSNQVKHYSPAKCSKCNKDVLLLLKQKGQTYSVVDIAISKVVNSNVENTDNTIIAPTIENEEQKEEIQEFICPECKKVCKSQIGLKSHMKTHNN